MNDDFIKAKELLNLASTKECNADELINALRLAKEEDENFYMQTLKSLSVNNLANAAVLMPDFMLNDMLSCFSASAVARAVEELESDDATDLIQNLENIDEKKAELILNSVEQEHKKDISLLKSYAQNSAGAYMQTEYLQAFLEESLNSAVQRYKKLKNEGEIEQVQQFFVTDEKNVLQYCLPFGEALFLDFDVKFKELLQDKKTKLINYFVYDNDDIDKVVNLVKSYDLSVIAVVDKDMHLMGRITYDDIHDYLQEQATEQIYNLVGVDDDAEEETVFKATKARGFWLFINLITSLISANIISFFSGEIEALVALAVLMPIVASMGGNTGSQALTVTVRRLSLGEIKFAKAKHIILRELKISLFNGFVFACIMSIIAYVWFDMYALGVVIALSMLINLSLAGFIGSVVPLSLKKLGYDPAVGSSVILTALTDALGFFSFLLLAKLILL